jgi:hypothetical protein
LLFSSINFKEFNNSISVGRFYGSLFKQLSISNCISEDGFINKSDISTPRQNISIFEVAITAVGAIDQHSGGMCPYSFLYFSTIDELNF